MAKYRLVGLASVCVGDVNTTTYAMPSTFTTINNIVPGTAVLAIEMPTKNKYFTEDSDYADIVMTEEGAKTVEFATRDMSLSYLTLALGGSNNTTAWSAGTTPRGVVNKALQLVSKAYAGKTYTFTIPVAEFSGGAALRFSNKGATEPGVLNFAAEVIMGENSTGNVAPITATLS